MTTRTIVIQDLTIVDCAVLNGRAIYGESFRVHATLTGDITDDEQVVLDFGTAKKQIKQIIDGEFGIDHKLLDMTEWALPEGADYKTRIQSNTRSADGSMTLAGATSSVVKLGDHYARLVQLSGQEHDERTTAIAAAMTYMNTVIREQIPNIRVVLIGDPAEQQLPGIFPENYDVAVERDFRYVHGLPCSTSVGCQNIAHGHRSVVALGMLKTTPLNAMYILDSVLSQIATESPDGDYEVYFTSTDHVTVATQGHNQASNSGSVQVKYDSNLRGKQSLTFDATDTNDCMVTSISQFSVPATTIENLVSEIAKLVEEEIEKTYGLPHEPFILYVSEGLTKGAVHAKA